MKQIVLTIVYYASLVWVVLLVGFLFVPHDIDHTRLEHLFPVVAGIVVAAYTYQKPQ